MNIDEKLKKFEKLCLEMSEMDKQNLTKKLDDKAKNKIDKSIENYKQKLENKLKKEEIKLEKEFNKKSMDLTIAYKKKVLAEYNNEKNEIFEICKQKLIEYTNTEEYNKSLENMFIKAMDMLDNKERITIYVLKKDKEKFDFMPYGEIEFLDDSYIGGVKLQNKNMLVDNTILTNLKEKIYGTEESN